MSAEQRFLGYSLSVCTVGFEWHAIGFSENEVPPVADSAALIQVLMGSISQT
jgi:hypothetical protein